MPLLPVKLFTVIYFAPGRGVKYCDQRVCLSVCPLLYLENHTSKFHLIFCTCCQSPWLYPPVTAMRYVMYFLFCGYHVSKSKTTHMFRPVRQIAARGEACRLRLHLVTGPPNGTVLFCSLASVVVVVCRSL